MRRPPKTEDLQVLDQLSNPDQIISQCPNSIKSHVKELLLDGVTIIRRSLPTTLCDELREGFTNFQYINSEIFVPNQDEFGHYGRIINLHVAYTPLIQLFQQNQLALAVQDYLFDAEAVLYTSLFYKRGSAQSIHRDTPYFTTIPEYRYFGVWVALEDTDPDNGPLAVVRGGHLIPELDREAIARRYYDDLDHIDPASVQLWQAYQEELTRECERRGLTAETLCVNKGDTIIWHPQTPHGGAPISDLHRTRFSLVMHTTPVGVPVYQQNVFFHPSKPVSDVASWNYLKFKERQYADFKDVGFTERGRIYQIKDFRV
jgi:phytanoyl-CoA hydroxylase